jgi:hypothetical protein
MITTGRGRRHVGGDDPGTVGGASMDFKRFVKAVASSVVPSRLSNPLQRSSKPRSPSPGGRLPRRVKTTDINEHDTSSCRIAAILLVGDPVRLLDFCGEVSLGVAGPAPCLLFGLDDAVKVWRMHHFAVQQG